MDLSDEALIESFQRTKDSSHFTSLVRRYQNRIYTAVYRILGNTEEAEEVVQETYIKVHQNLDKFNRQASFAAWMFRIANNICLDVMRTRQRRKAFHLLTFDPQVPTKDECSYSEVTSQVVSQVADGGPCPAQQIDINEEAEVIQSSLKALPDAQRAVLVLHDIEGFSYQEIADIVGASIGTVRSRLHYGRIKLRELLEPYFSSTHVSPAPR